MIRSSRYVAPTPFIMNASYTRVPSRSPVPSRAELEAGYQRAVALDGARGAAASGGYRMYAVTTSGVAESDLRDGFAIVGSAAECDVRLDADPAIRARHLFVQSEVLDDGGGRLRVLDLGSPRGFGLADGSWVRSLSIAGPLVLAVGGCVIVALPSLATHAATMPRPAGERGVLGRVRLAKAVVATPAFEAARSISALPLSYGAVSISMLGEPSNDDADDVRSSDTPSAYELTFSSPEGNAIVPVTAVELDRGVIVGRQRVPAIEGLDAFRNPGVSRDHLLLLRCRWGCVAYDLATVNGTFHEGRRIRSRVMTEDGTELVLGRASSVAMRWRAAGA